MPLTRYKCEIEEIVSCASKELDLEQRLRSTEEEWAEQVLHFSRFKNRGLLMLDTRYWATHFQAHYSRSPQPSH